MVDPADGGILEHALSQRAEGDCGRGLRDAA
jgi:hypothetical protein